MAVKIKKKLPQPKIKNQLHNMFTRGKNPMDSIATTEVFADLLENSIGESIENKVVKGIVVEIDNKSVLIDVGWKSEGRVPIEEFSEGPKPEVGSEIEVFVENIDAGGRMILSRERALKEVSWDQFEEKFRNNEKIMGKVLGRVNSGYACYIGGGIIAFLPNSQISSRSYLTKPFSGALTGIEMEVKIVKMDKGQGNIVVSKRAVEEEAKEEERKNLLSSIKEGMILEGVVKAISKYGAFVDLGPLDGLLHITDISWYKIDRPSEVLSLGQHIKVMVTAYNPETKRVSLGLKQLETNPWEDLGSKYHIGEIYSGVVTRITEYGAFVSIGGGGEGEFLVEGLVHSSEIDWNAKNVNVKRLLKLGDKVNVKLLEMDLQKHKIRLSIKQTKINPWVEFAKKHKIGEVITGTIINVEQFGIFVSINKGHPELAIDVFIPTVELTWNDHPEKCIKKYKEGEEISGAIFNIDVDRERVTLSVRQLEKKPSAEFVSKYPRDKIVTCLVRSVNNDGIEVELEDDNTVRSFIKRNELAKHRPDQRSDRFAVGERIDAKIISQDWHNRRLELSIKSLEIEEEKRVLAEYGSTSSGARLGPLIQALGLEDDNDADKNETEN